MTILSKLAIATQTSKLDEATECCNKSLWGKYNAIFMKFYLEHFFRRIVHLLLAFMNSIQAIYNFKSLGRNVDI